MPAHKGNLYALGNHGGKPPKYSSPAEMEKKIIEYFDQLVNTETDQSDIPTITGLALYLGFSDHHSLIDYCDRNKGHEEYAPVIKRAKEVIVYYHERRMSSTTPTGSIFWLKNFGWKDAQTIDHTNNGNSFNTLTDAELVTRLNQLLAPREKG
jgi:hypothetical protein